MSLPRPHTQERRFATRGASHVPRLIAVQEHAVVAMQVALKAGNVAYPGHDDRITCARFLKARKWEVPKAVQMYQEMVQFRKERRLDDPDYNFAFPEIDQVR